LPLSIFTRLAESISSISIAEIPVIDSKWEFEILITNYFGVSLYSTPPDPFPLNG
jgi:hypothetical protein